MVDDIVASVEYRSIEGFPGYQVGSDESIWSARGSRGKEWRRIKTPVIGPGYKGFSIYDGDGKQHIVLLHKIVADAFLGPKPSPEMEVRHLDGNALNCLPSNLAWGTRKQNVEDAIIHGTATIGENNGQSKLKNDDVRKIKTMLANGERVGIIAKTFKVTSSAISSIKAGKSWKRIA